MQQKTKKLLIQGKKPPGKLRIFNHLQKNISLNHSTKNDSTEPARKPTRGLLTGIPRTDSGGAGGMEISGEISMPIAESPTAKPEEHAPRNCTDLIAPKIDKKCLTTKLQKSRRRSHAIFTDAGPAGDTPDPPG